MQPSRSPWFRDLRVSQYPALSLYCFPPAGAGASFYRPWVKHLPDNVDLRSVQYPGREDRIQEPCATDLNDLASCIAEAILQERRSQVALFGHSLGAAIAYEVACRLEPHCHIAKLFVSGRPAPLYDRLAAVADASDDALWEDVRRLGGTRSSVLENDELRALLLPILRCDYALSERYVPSATTRLDCEVVACLGASDPEVNLAEAQAWMQVTRGRFVTRSFPGDHFYVLTASSTLVREIVHLLGVDAATARAWPSTP